MFARRLARATSTALALALAAGALAACGAEEEEAHREGLREELGGLEYNVFLTRQLNPALPSDQPYYDGPEPRRGYALYGVFLEVCNRGEDGEHPSATQFRIVDNQEQSFRPVELPEDNAFAYHPRELAPRECIPERGSPAQQGATGGSMLLFELPLEATENRPLELEIGGNFDPVTAVREHITFTLDI